ncbi:MAG: DUF190 domain-containing protein [Chthoniobacterales bacterium]
MNDSADHPISEHDAILLRIFLSERSRWGHQPLFEAIVVKARDAGLAGATVLRGPLGYGAGGTIQTAKILQLSDNLPVVVEIVDSEESIRGFLESITDMMDGGLATMQSVRAVHFPKQAK